MNSHTTNAYPITKEVYNYLLPVYERGRLVEKAGGYWFLGNLKTFKELIDLNNELNDETDD